MPYIKQDDREKLYRIFSPYEYQIKSAGELNFVLTQVLKLYVYSKGESYQTYNDIIGALEGAKLELYRRRIAPYEDTKINENGDVY